jgi:phosphoribosylglycinamide formyltransferase 1
MNSKLKIGFLASHRGSNMQAVIDACKNGTLPAEVVVVISNNQDSYALQRAKDNNIPAFHLSEKSLGHKDGLDKIIADTLSKFNVELVVLAGYMKMIGPEVLARFNNKIINIHPSLLPKHGGQGMYGHKVHEAVLKAGDVESGATVHLVNEVYDKGRILNQVKVAVESNDTVKSLADKVIKLEHKLLVETIGRISTGEINLN